MELLKEQYLHNKFMNHGEAAKAWQGAMQLLCDMPTLTPPPTRETGGHMKKRILADTNSKQFAIIPTFGIIRWVEDYKFRIGFLWGIWQLSIGCFKERI